MLARHNSVRRKQNPIFFLEMASQLRIAIVTCLLLLILMEDTKPVFAGKKKRLLKELEARMNALNETLQCESCSLVEELTDWLNKIEKKVRACSFDFEDGLCGWNKTGTAFNNQPTYGDNPTARGRPYPANQQGDWWIGGYEDRPSPEDQPGIQLDTPQGTLTSPFFNITGDTITFLIGGGCDINTVRAELIIGDQVVMKATGKCHQTMKREAWDVRAFVGQRAQFKLVDSSSAGWGHIDFDDLKGDISCEHH
ncbi:hypothetical protein ACROYT_G030913 [Oculina patagonica]